MAKKFLLKNHRNILFWKGAFDIKVALCYTKENYKHYIFTPIQKKDCKNFPFVVTVRYFKKKIAWHKVRHLKVMEILKSKL